MKKIEKEYTKRFSNQQLPNGDFDVDGLWDAVSTNLDVVAPAAAAGTHAVWSAKWIWVLAFSGIVGTACIAYVFVSKNQMLSTQIENIDTKETKLVTNEESKNILSTSVDSKSVAKMGSRLDAKNEALLNTNDTSNNLKTSQSTSIEVENKKQKASTKTYLKLYQSNGASARKSMFDSGFDRNSFQNKSTRDLSSGNIPSKENQTTIQQSNQQSNSPVKLDALFNEKNNKIGMQASLLPSLSALVLPDRSEQFLPRLNASDNDIEVDKPKIHSWQFSLLGGANNFLFNYSTTEPSALARQKNESETGQWGYQLGFQTDLVFNNQWVISSGLSYHNLYSRFDLVGQTNTQVFKEDVILQVLVDSNTGEVLNSIMGDTIVNAVTTRNIVHHNRYQQFSIPLDFGFQKIHRGFIYGLRAGLGFHYVSAQSGRALDLDGEIVVFDTDSTYTPFRSFHIGFRFSPLTGYQFSNQWAITFQPQWAWNPQIGFDNPNLKLTTQQFNFVLGLRYSL